MRILWISAVSACALLLASPASAQLIGSGHVLGNGTASAAAPTDTSLLNVLIQAGSGITRSGNTSILATSTGALTNGDCVTINSGNFIDAGGPCTVGGGGGTVSAGTANQLAYYASNGTAVTGTFSPNIPSTGQWWQALGAYVSRWNDKMLVGGATDWNGVSNYPTVGANNDWVSNYEMSWTAVPYLGNPSGPVYPLTYAAVLAVENNTISGNVAILGATHTQNEGSCTLSTCGTSEAVAAFAAADNPTGVGPIWAFYGESHCLGGASTAISCWGEEIDVETRFNNVSNPTTPYSALYTVGYSAGCGAGIENSAFNCDAGYILSANPKQWMAGLIFQPGSIATDVNSQIPAIAMPPYYEITWYNSSYAGGSKPFASIYGDANNNLNINIAGEGDIVISGTPAASCSGSALSPQFRVTDGIVTHC